MLSKAQAEHDKTAAMVEELEKKIVLETTARDEGDGSCDEAGMSREEMLDQHSSLMKAVDALRTELAAYSDNDPAEFARKTQEVENTKTASVNYTDQILAMEGWMKSRFGREDLQTSKKEWYGIEYDEEEEGLKEV